MNQLDLFSGSQTLSKGPGPARPEADQVEHSTLMDDFKAPAPDNQNDFIQDAGRAKIRFKDGKHQVVKGGRVLFEHVRLVKVNEFIEGI